MSSNDLTKMIAPDSGISIGGLRAQKLTAGRLGLLMKLDLAELEQFSNLFGESNDGEATVDKKALADLAEQILLITWVVTTEDIREVVRRVNGPRDELVAEAYALGEQMSGTAIDHFEAVAALLEDAFGTMAVPMESSGGKGAPSPNASRHRGGTP